MSIRELAKAVLEAWDNAYPGNEVEDTYLPIEALRQALAEDEWVSVGERLPDYDEVVLWWFESGGIVMEDMPHDGPLPDFFHGSKSSGRRTHWRPLPAPPKGA